MIRQITEVPFQNAELEITVLALHRGRSDLGAFSYLQGIRSGVLARVRGGDPETSAVAISYHAMKCIYYQGLADLVDFEPDAILTPPTSRPELSTPYFDAVYSKHKNAVDLTTRFSRLPSATAGTGTSVDEFISQLTYVPSGDESRFKTLLIVDDVLARGTTVAAIVRKLREFGLPLECKIFVACPLWIEQKAQAQV
jgi:hypothetical protein